MKELDARRPVVVDECGSNIALTPRYGWAPKGQRAHGNIPRNRGKNVTLIASVGWEGIGESMILEGGTTGTLFEQYIEQILAPTLRPGQIVVMDNLSCHKGEKVHLAIEARGCRLLFLPAYSPDLSTSLPIALVRDDRVCLIAPARMRSSSSCGLVASGGRWTRRSCAPIRQRMRGFKPGWKQACSSRSGRWESSELMNAAGSRGTGWHSTKRSRKRRWVEKNRASSHRPGHVQRQTQPADREIWRPDWSGG